MDLSIAQNRHQRQNRGSEQTHARHRHSSGSIPRHFSTADCDPPTSSSGTAHAHSASPRTSTPKVTGTASRGGRCTDHNGPCTSSGPSTVLRRRTSTTCPVTQPCTTPPPCWPSTSTRTSTTERPNPSLNILTDNSASKSRSNQPPDARAAARPSTARRRRLATRRSLSPGRSWVRCLGRSRGFRRPVDRRRACRPRQRVGSRRVAG